MENLLFYGQISYKWPLPIAMLVYQTVGFKHAAGITESLLGMVADRVYF